MDYRRINPEDISHVTEFVIQGLRPDLYPLHLSKTKIRSACEFFMKSQADFHLAAFDGGKMVGGIAVHVAEMLWFQRSEAHVVMFFATVPGVGFKLLRAAMQWVHGHIGIRRVLWPLEDDAPSQRMQSIAARRFGFNRSQQVLLFYKE